MMSKLFIFLVTFFFFVTIAIAQSNDSKDTRWYTKEQVKKGEQLFLKNCAVCHGEKAQKTVNWKKILEDGSYPPPPLNGDAHAWHHPKSQLKRIISKGGSLYDGKMPGFDALLSESDKDEVISYFQNFWDEEKYSLWLKNGGLTR